MRESFPSKEMKYKIISEKHKQLPNIMQENNIDCWIIFVRETITTPDSSMHFVVGSEVVAQSAFIFVLREDTMQKIAIVANYDADTEREKGIWSEVIAYDKGISQTLEEKIKELDPQKIALNFSMDDFSSDGLTHGMYLVLKDILAEYEKRFVSAQPIINMIRGCKSDTEIQLIKKACETTELINDTITSFLKIGLSELEIQQKFQEEVDKRKLGFSWQREQNPAIDAEKEKDFGHVLPQPHYFTKKGGTLHNDFGIKQHGYCSDLQRMWFFGSEEELPDELRHAMDTVVKAIQLGAENIRPGLQGYEIDKVVREYLIKEGYEEYMHGLGHQVGIMAHDGSGLLGPLWERYGDGPKQKIKVGQVYTIEPNVKTKNYGMVSMEEMIVVTPEGCKFLVEPRRDFIYIK